MWPLSGKEVFELIYHIACPHSEWNDIEINGILTDSRKIPILLDSTVQSSNPGTIPLLFIAIQGEKFDGHSYLKDVLEKGVALALVNKNSSYLHDLSDDQLNKCLLVDDVVFSLRIFAQGFRKSFLFPVFGIGGSNGKTTTKEILSSFLSFDNHKVTKTQKSENGFLGVAMTLLQTAHRKDNPPFALVLEIGIDEIGAMKQHIDIAVPNIVILTALGPEHLTGLHNWETAAKEELILFSTPNCKRIWQLHDPKIVEEFLKKSAGGNNFNEILDDMCVLEKNNNILTSLDHPNVIFWSVDAIGPQHLNITIENHSKVLFQDKIPLFGKHNAANFVLSFAAAMHLGLKPENIINGFKNFIPPPQRAKVSHFSHDIILFDDTYNASPSSVEAALNLINIPEWRLQKKIIVLGDMLELGDESKFWHESLYEHLKEFHNTHLCLFGPAMYNCYKLLKDDNENSFAKQRLMVDWLDQNHDPAQFLKTLSPISDGSIILVKGSRGMRLERFVHCVEKLFS